MNFGGGWNVEVDMEGEGCIWIKYIICVYE